MRARSTTVAQDGVGLNVIYVNFVLKDLRNIFKHQTEIVVSDGMSCIPVKKKRKLVHAYIYELMSNMCKLILMDIIKIIQHHKMKYFIF